MPEQDEQWAERAIEAGKVFTPTSPIDERSLFAGRTEQVRQIIDVVNQKGQHAMLFGERGVGKTSLANVLSSFLRGESNVVIAPRVNCDSTDDFNAVWRKVFSEIRYTITKGQLGFGRQPHTFRATLLDGFADVPITPEIVKNTLQELSEEALPILIIDEFDRLAEQPRRAFADTVKMLSDHAVNATVVLVGVADAVERLIEEHASVERALVQIPLPRMSADEIQDILRKGVSRLKMTISENSVSRVTKLSQGLPHYTHLLALHACRSALDDRREGVVAEDVSKAIRRAIQHTQQSIRSAYDVAIRSAKKDSLFAVVLLACAMATPNEFGYFAAQDVRDPMKQITNRKYEIPGFAKHLNAFCEDIRGPVLEKDGTERLFRYRFIDPLLQPFVIMKGIDEERISVAAFD